MKHVVLLLMLVAIAGCQSSPVDPNDADAVIPDVAARLSRKRFVTGPEQRVNYEERYVYGPGGRLATINRYNLTPTGTLEQYGADEFVYDAEDRLTRKNQYYRNTGGSLTLNTFTTYEYPEANLLRETTYGFDNNGATRMAYSRTETTYEQGRKARVVFFYNDGQGFKKSYETIYQYASGRLTAEAMQMANGNAGNVFRYTYAGRTAKVDEYMPNRAESISEQRFAYDSRGRMTRQEVVRANPLLCVAMLPNSATLYEYLD